MRAFQLATIVAANILCSVRPVLGQCTNFAEFTAMSVSLNEACCEAAGTECTMGIPSSCPGACATVLLPMRDACGDFLKGSGAMFKTSIDSAAEKCAPPPPPPPPPCTNFAEFTAISAPLNEACCEGAGTDCTMGIPSSCPGDCATVLLPVHDACGDFLNGDGAMFKTLIDSAAGQCAAASTTCPCLNGKCPGAARYIFPY